MLDVHNTVKHRSWPDEASLVFFFRWCEHAPLLTNIWEHSVQKVSYDPWQCFVWRCATETGKMFDSQHTDTTRVTLTWHASKYTVYKLHQSHIPWWSSCALYVSEDVPLVEVMYPAFTRMPCESYHEQLWFLLCLCDIFWALINSLVCWASSVSD